MNLSQLYYFRKLAQLEHYTKAAQELFISQPSLSSSIAAMEEELHIKLFQKKGRNVKLTKDGKEFYAHVCRCLDALQDGIDSAHDKSGMLGGCISIAAPPSLLLEFVPELVRDYREHHPSQVTFQFHNETSLEKIKDGIQDGTYDFAIFPDVDSDNALCALALSNQPFCAFVPNSHPLAKKKALSFRDLQAYPLITYPETTDAGQKIRDILESHSLSAADSFPDEFSVSGCLSQNDRLVAIAPNTPVLCRCDRLTALPLPELPENTSTICLLYSRKNHMTKPMESFLSFAQERFSVAQQHSA
ncbi:MAG: LysR family transcriptional regulator [Oscillospiraceae bacterium]|nr:LysR family transcriptional regulator [Oscillospiraceae bacterium]